MLLAARADFEPANVQEGASALYYNPADGTGYVDFPMFAERVAALRGRTSPNGQKLAVWGCGFGYLVKRLVDAGYDAFGFDASSYAITRGKALNPSIASRLFVRSATVSGDVSGSRADAGLKGQSRFALLVTDDMLTCLTDAERATALPLLRNTCSTNLLHIVTLKDQWAAARGLADARCTWKTAAEWKAILQPPDQVADEHGALL